MNGYPRGYPPIGSDPGNPIKLLPTDRRFHDSPEEGDPRCICSRCDKPIGEGEAAIRCWPEDGRFELRYHPACLGFQTFPQDEE